jgi:hypothetical protein
MLPTTPKTKKTLPILNSLDDVRVASPCDAEWDGMRPVTDSDGARARFCGSCEKNVYDLSAMTRADAFQLIERHEGRCCVRFYQRPDGTVLTQDCPVGVRALLKRAERRTLMAAAAGVGAIAAFVAFLAGQNNPVSCKLQAVEQHIESVTPPPLDPVVPVEPMMGAMPPPDAVRSMGEMMPQPPKRPPHVMGKIKAPPRETKGKMMMGDVAQPEDKIHVDLGY